MKSFSPVALCVLMAFCNLAIAQSQPPAGTMLVNTIYVGADGKYESAPDTAVLQFNIAGQDATAKVAYDKASAAAQQIRQALTSNGIDLKTAEISSFAVQPMYDWKDPKHRVIGYRVVSNVRVRLHEFSKVGALTQQMAEVDSTENQSLNYTLENVEAAKAKATEDAMHKAHSLANTAAVAGGRSLGELLYASVDVQSTVIPLIARPMAPMRVGAEAVTPAAPTDNFTPQSITITAHVNTMYGLK